jgi:hypothetical protein
MTHLCLLNGQDRLGSPVILSKSAVEFKAEAALIVRRTTHSRKYRRGWIVRGLSHGAFWYVFSEKFRAV